jgi:hypothetical protein
MKLDNEDSLVSLMIQHVPSYEGDGNKASNELLQRRIERGWEWQKVWNIIPS